MQTEHAIVTDALHRAIELGEGGLQIAAYLGQELIVDQWAGLADVEQQKPVDGDTLFAVFSVTKGITAAAVNMQAERGLLDLDAPIARYWPEFGQNGKENITIRHVLTHRAGVPQMPAGITTESMCDWNWMISAYEREKPLFPTDTTNCYHGLGWGWLVAECVVRTDPRRRSFGTWVEEEICRPLGIDSLYMGLPRSETVRVATLFGPPTPVDKFGSMPEPASPSPNIHNQQIVRECCHPGAGVICSARSMARFWAMLANGGSLDGIRLLSENTIRNGLSHRKNTLDPDLMIGYPVPVGRAGWWIVGPGNHMPVGENPNTLYNPGGRRVRCFR
jgi:CubicO group peptidase (beta-lactamase class C family)